MLVCGGDDGLEGVVIPQLFQRRNAPKRYMTQGLGSCGGQHRIRQISRVTRRDLAVPTSNIYGSGSDMKRVANTDVSMTDQPQEMLALLEEDRLRQVARHVKDYIPGNSDGDVDEQKM